MDFLVAQTNRSTTPASLISSHVIVARHPQLQKALGQKALITEIDREATPPLGAVPPALQGLSEKVIVNLGMGWPVAYSIHRGRVIGLLNGVTERRCFFEGCGSELNAV